MNTTNLFKPLTVELHLPILESVVNKHSGRIHLLLPVSRTNGEEAKLIPAWNIHRTSATTANSSSNDINKLVKRDGSGNFSAGTITADLDGTASNATTATILDTSNTLISW